MSSNQLRSFISDLDITNVSQPDGHKQKQWRQLSVSGTGDGPSSLEQNVDGLISPTVQGTAVSSFTNTTVVISSAKIERKSKELWLLQRGAPIPKKSVFQYRCSLPITVLNIKMFNQTMRYKSTQ